MLELGVPQELSFFTASRTPVTVVLLLDSSASVRSNLLPVQKAANRFIKKLARGDRARIGFFHEQVVFGPRFTDDMKEHSAMINQMRPQRSTHLYDALVESFEMLEPVPERKALLVFSDGEDQGSRTSMEALSRRPGGPTPRSTPSGSWAGARTTGCTRIRGFSSRSPEVTGGRAFFPENDKEMRKAFDRIRDELHHQYRMGYVPAGGEEGPGRWRAIQVELTRRKDLVVRSRLGYYSDRPPAP